MNALTRRDGLAICPAPQLMRRSFLHENPASLTVTAGDHGDIDIDIAAREQIPVGEVRVQHAAGDAFAKPTSEFLDVRAGSDIREEILADQ